MPQEGLQDQGMQQMWAVPMQQQQQQGDRGRGDHNQMGGHGPGMGHGQMMQGPSQGMMWGEPQQQQSFQQQWELPRAGQQQQSNMAGSAPSSESTWNTSVAEFVPQSQKAGGPGVPFVANSRTPFQLSANAKPFEKPSVDSTAQQSQGSEPKQERRKGMQGLKNARLDKTGAPLAESGVDGVAVANDVDVNIALQPSGTGQPIITAKEKAVAGVTRKMPGSKPTTDGLSTISALSLESPYTAGGKPAPLINEIKQSQPAVAEKGLNADMLSPLHSVASATKTQFASLIDVCNPHGRNR
jgi:hypothetical protein